MPWLFSSFQVSALFGVFMQGGEPEWRHGSWRVYFCSFFFFLKFIYWGQYMWKSRNNWQDSVLSENHMKSLNRTQVTRLGSQCFYPLSHITSPLFLNELSFSLSLVLSGVSSIHITCFQAHRGKEGCRVVAGQHWELFLVTQAARET